MNGSLLNSTNDFSGKLAFTELVYLKSKYNDK